MTAHHSQLREKLIALRNHPDTVPPLKIPLTGLIDPITADRIQQLARDAKAGAHPARDALYETFRKRLGRMGYVLRPWPNTPFITGLWDRDDVNQEGWIVFAELLDSWDGDAPFVKYLFARYPWRLRDRVLRGIGKPMPPIGEVRIREENLLDILLASDTDQPESALLASILLQKLLNRALGGEALTALRSPQTERGRKPRGNPTSLPKVKPA